MTTVPIADIVAGGDIARLCGVSAQAVSNWRDRHADFPEPFTTVSNGSMPLYRRSEVLRWYRARLSPERLAAMRELVQSLDEEEPK